MREDSNSQPGKGRPRSYKVEHCDESLSSGSRRAMSVPNNGRCGTPIRQQRNDFFPIASTSNTSYDNSDLGIIRPPCVERQEKLASLTESVLGSAYDGIESISRNVPWTLRNNDASTASVNFEERRRLIHGNQQRLQKPSFN